MSERRYIVICRDNLEPGETKGKLILASQTAWKQRSHAEEYARGLPELREAVVVRCSNLEFFSDKRESEWGLE